MATSNIAPLSAASPRPAFSSARKRELLTALDRATAVVRTVASAHGDDVDTAYTLDVAWQKLYELRDEIDRTAEAEGAS